MIAEGRIVAGCEYDPTRQGRGSKVPAVAQALADHVASSAWQPAPLYIVDIAAVDGSPRVMELNLFSGSDFYDCDADAIVLAACRIADALHAESSAQVMSR